MADNPPIATDEIRTVTKFVRDDDGTKCVECPHCKQVIGLQSGPIRGEMFQHRRREYQGAHGVRATGCDGWFEVSHDAKAVQP